MSFFELSLSTVFWIGKKGRSSDLLPLNAFVIRRGMKREGRAVRGDIIEGVASGCPGTPAVNGLVKDDSFGDVDGRTVDVRERLDRVIGCSLTAGAMDVLKEREDINGSLALGTVVLPSSTDQRPRRPGRSLLLEGPGNSGSSDVRLLACSSSAVATG